MIITSASKRIKNRLLNSRIHKCRHKAFITLKKNVALWHELEAYIREVYAIADPGEKFSVVALEEWANDSQHAFRNMKPRPLDKYDQNRLDEWKDDPLGNHPYRLRLILQDMVNTGHLTLGNYLVTVCW